MTTSNKIGLIWNNFDFKAKEVAVASLAQNPLNATEAQLQ